MITTNIIITNTTITTTTTSTTSFAVPNSLSHGSYSPSQLGSHGGRSPVSSPTPQTPSLPLGSSALHMGGYPSPGEYQLLFN